MTNNKIVLIILLISIFSIFLIITNVQAELAENILKVDLIKYDPSPVSPDSDFSIWVKIKNIGDNDVNGASIEFLPKYPFTIKSDENAKYPGIIRKNDELIYKFIIHVDKNAIVGTSSIELGYRIDNTLVKREFNIEIGSDIVDTVGTVKIDKYTISPEVLMSGDVATVSLTLKNSASQYTIKMNDKDYSLNAQIQSVELIGNDVIEMVGEQYYNVGIVGPGDSIDLSYIIKAKDNTSDGTYYLDLNLKGSSRLYSLNSKIPIKIYSPAVETTISEISPDKIILNIANNRPNTIYSVKVLPIGNITLEPSEYFIGTIESDELFTAKFNIKKSEEQNIKFRVKFKNGDNWHEVDTNINMINNSMATQEVNKPWDSIIVISIFIIIIGFIILKYRKKK